MKHIKKLLTLLLTLVMAVGVLTISANASYGQIASGDGWSASANSDFCDEDHDSAGGFIASHNGLPANCNHSSTYDHDVGFFYSGNVTVTIDGDSKANKEGVHYIGAGYGYHHWWKSSSNHGTNYASVNYYLDDDGTLIIDNGSAVTGYDYVSYVEGNGGNLLVLSGKVYVKGTFGNIATGEDATVILNGDTTVNNTEVSYYGEDYDEANITGGTWFHDCNYGNSYDKNVPAGLTVNDGDVTIADGSPVLQYLVVSDGEVDLNGVGIENIYCSCGYNSAHTLTAGGIGLEVTGGEVTSTDTGTGSNNNTIVGKTYGIKQTGGTIELTGYGIKDTLEIGDDNYAGGAIYTNYTGSSSGNHTTLTDCDIYTVGGKVASYSSYNSSHQLNEDLSTIVVDDGYVTIISDSDPNYIKGSYNLIDYTGTLTDSYAYNTALEVNGGEVIVTNMAIDSASSSTIPVKVQNATVTLNGSTVVGGVTNPSTAITVKNTSDKTAKLTLDGTVEVNASSIGIDADGVINSDDSGTTITMKAGTIQYGDSGRVDYGIDADNIAEIEITGGTIKAEYFGIDANTVPDFSVENATIDVSNSGISYGICANNCGSTTPVLIKDSTITVASNDKNDYACGLYLYSTVLKIENTDTTGKTEITVTADDEHNHAYGVYVDDSSVFTMNANTTITAKVGAAMSEAYGVYVTDTSKATVNDGKIVADVSADTVTNAKVYGIYNNSTTTTGVTVNDGTITVGQAFGNATTNRAYGMFNESGNTLFKNGTVNVYSDHTVDSYGVFVADGHVDMTGGTINMKYDHINGVQADGGSFNMGAESQVALGTTKGGVDHPYIHFNPEANAGTGKVYGVYANGGAVELYAGEVDVTGVAGFTAVRVDAGSLQVLTNEKVNPATEDADDEIVFTALANTNGGTAFHAQGGTWAIRGNGAKFVAETALQVYAHVDDALSGGSFIGMMKNTAAEKNLDDLFLANHYLRNDSSNMDKITEPSDGTRVTSASVKSMGNNDTCYTVTDAEWELRYALEADNTGKIYTMPVDITLDANAGTFGALPKQMDIDVTTADHTLDVNGKTLSYTYTNTQGDDTQLIEVNAGGLLTKDTATAKGKIQGNGLNVVKVTGNGTYTNGETSPATNGANLDSTGKWNAIRAEGSTVVVNSGELTGTNSGIEVVASGANVTINGGTITGGSSNASDSSIRAITGTVTVNGGTMKTRVTVWNSSAGDTATVTVYGGTFEDDVIVYNGDANIYGGTYAADKKITVYGGTVNFGNVPVGDATSYAPTVASAIEVESKDGVSIADAEVNFNQGTFNGTVTVKADTSSTYDTTVTVNDGTFNDDVTFTGGETTIYGGSFESGEPFTVDGGAVEVKTGTTEGATAPVIDRDITVSGGSLTVDNGTVNGKVEKTGESTVCLKVDTSYKQLKNSYNSEKLAAMLDNDVTYIRDGVETNVIERNNAGTERTVTSDTDNTKYLVLCDEDVSNIEIKDTHDNVASSVAYSRGDLATALGGSAKTITLKATENSTATVRELRWTVATSDGGDASKVTVANADVRIGNTNTINVASDAPAGTYTITVSDLDSSDTAASATYTITISKIDLATDTKVTVSATDQTYTAGQSKTTTVTVKYNGYTIGDSDYDLGGTTATDKGSYNASVTAKAESLDIIGSKTASWQIKDTVTPPSGGGGGGGAVAPKTYTVTCDTGVKADVKSSAAGKTITLTVSEGYENIVVKDAKGNAVTVSGNTFTMPASNVTVSVSKIAAATSYDKCDHGINCVLTAFTDVDNDAWYHDGIHYCLDNGMMNGVGDGKFAPNASTTRAMIWTILARLDGETITGASWADDAKAWAVKVGISDGTNPNGDVTREQLAAMLYRFAVLKGYDVTASGSLNAYSDAASVSAYAVEAMQWSVGAGIINGYNGRLKPVAGATRAEVATMLMRFCENVVK